MSLHNGIVNQPHLDSSEAYYSEYQQNHTKRQGEGDWRRCQRPHKPRRSIAIPHHCHHHDQAREISEAASSIKSSYRKTEEDRNKDQLAAAVENEFVYVYQLPANRSCIELLNTITFSFMVGRHEKNDVLEIPFKDAPRGVELVKARIEGAAPLPTEPRGQRESGRPIAYIKARTTAVRRVTLSVVHRDGGSDNGEGSRRTLQSGMGLIYVVYIVIKWSGRNQQHPNEPYEPWDVCHCITVPVWHIRAKYCLVIFNNPAAHVSKILTVEWSPDGRPLFSGGFDHKIVCWNLAEENVKSHLKKCYKRTKAGRSIENIKDELNMDPRLRLAEKIFENVSRIGASQHRQLVFSDKGRILSLEESDTCPISVLNYELDYNRPSTSGPTTCEYSTEDSKVAVKTRKELSLSMPPASTNPADENITMDQPPVKAHGQDKSSNREYSLHSNEEQPHQNRSGTEKCQKDEVDVGKRRSEPPTTVRAMDNVANSPEEAMDDNMTNGTSSNHVSMTRGRSRGRPIKIKFGWQRSAVNNARQPTSGQPGSQQPRRGVGRPRWNGIRQQSPRLPPTVQTTTNLSESSPTAIRGSKRSWETTKTEHGQSSEGAETAQDAVGSSIQP
ncbi:Protein CBG07523 [Caenorhabditis briggsae]|uniref:Protein CBG07523 n=1 Tax=Caenorhabditis briggsae TaxID=6238 RepID=A8X4M4_CAEBR|nr:Protein CBG07523 [Caenorhabditis briggsae]CAP27584.2 Protein CBG07523 [Caenorhabditis briggsae]